jgi:hypothetical protein
MRKIVVKLMGGLGNQMFQYAAAKKVCELLNEDNEIIFDVNFLEDRTTGVVYRDYDLSIFEIHSDLNRESNQSSGKFVVTDDNINEIIKNIHQLKFSDKDLYFDGFFQLHSLVDNCMNQVYKFNGFSDIKTEKFFLENVTDKSLMINVRRADYVSRPNALLFHGFLGEEYVKKALSKFEKDEFDRIFIFSDEPEWCKNNLKIENSVVVDHEYAGTKFKDYLCMMSKFKKMIIPNSTFAWWAAWISENQNKEVKIVAPGKNLWLPGNPEKAKMVVPDRWNKIETL